MTVSKYYLGDIGTEIYAETGVDISAAVTLALKVKKPDGTKVEWAGVLEGTTQIKYTIVAGDFDQSGVYWLQAYAALASWTGHGESARFVVAGLFE